MIAIVNLSLTIKEENHGYNSVNFVDIAIAGGLAYLGL